MMVMGVPATAVRWQQLLTIPLRWLVASSVAAELPLGAPPSVSSYHQQQLCLHTTNDTHRSRQHTIGGARRPTVAVEPFVASGHSPRCRVALTAPLPMAMVHHYCL